MSTRAELVAGRIFDRIWAICKTVPPIKPPAAHWLDSDCCQSYCFPCAVKARGEEFDLGAPWLT